ncbi:MAG: hypothetical protein VB017_03510 [Endomicrobiaceae bacterium]|jgi:hypothetical protein|nr:hypothetical protein [Endomicrobiaceae bacterium]
MSKNKKEHTWMPSLKWMGKTLIIIYVLIIAAFFSFNILLKPYMRNIPVELTPWLDKAASAENK